MMKFGADYHSNIVCLTERFLWWKQCSLPGCGRISSYYLCQSGYVFARVCLLVGWLVCQHAYIITVEWISTNLGWRILICSWSLGLCLLLTSIWSLIQLAAASGYFSNKAICSLGNSVNG